MLSISESSRARGVEQHWFEQNQWSTSRVILQKEKQIEDYILCPFNQKNGIFRYI